MFLKEARVAASLDHANIAHVYDIGEVGRDTFFTMEYLHGEDLRYIMPRPRAPRVAASPRARPGDRHRRCVGAPLCPRQARSRRALAGDRPPGHLAREHRRHLRRRREGRRLRDRQAGRRSGALSAVALKGKLAYMSPEQLHNLPVDRRSDLFALGIVLYEITTQVRLFKGATEVQTMKAVMDGRGAAALDPCPGLPGRAGTHRPARAGPGPRRSLPVGARAATRARGVRRTRNAFASRRRRWPSGWRRRSGPSRRSGTPCRRPPPPAEPSVRKEGTARTKVVSRADVDAMPDAAAVGILVPIDLTMPAAAATSVRVLPAVLAVIARGGDGRRRLAGPRSVGRRDAPGRRPRRAGGGAGARGGGAGRRARTASAARRQPRPPAAARGRTGLRASHREGDRQPRRPHPERNAPPTRQPLLAAAATRPPSPDGRATSAAASSIIRAAPRRRRSRCASRSGRTGTSRRWRCSRRPWRLLRSGLAWRRWEEHRLPEAGRAADVPIPLTVQVDTAGKSGP